MSPTEQERNCELHLDSMRTAATEEFIRIHANQLEASGVARHFWPFLYNKLQNGVFDAGNSFQIALFEEDETSESANDEPEKGVVVLLEEGMDPQDGKHIYLIDHAWSCRATEARSQLLSNRALLNRMAALMGISPNIDEVLEDSKESLISVVDRVWDRMWLFNQTYSVVGATAEDSQPIWYVMDEFGSAIGHDLKPNFRCVPFYFVPKGESYSLLFPIREVEYMDVVTRNFIEGPYQRLTAAMTAAGDGHVINAPSDAIGQSDEQIDVIGQCLLLPWQPRDMTHVDWMTTEPDDAFVQGGRVMETLPLPNFIPLPLPTDRPIRVFSEYDVIRKNLKDARFEIVANTAEADILWLNTHFKEFREFSEECPHQRINQFPFEHIITVKDLLAVVCRRSLKPNEGLSDCGHLESPPVWLPTTYNLVTELPQFVSYFQRRQQEGLSNVWIIKPYNLARGIDTLITSNLNCILRQPATGPKIACKYIEDPVLFPRADVQGGPVKFDIRYIVLLQSVEPLRVAVYRKFWLRFANKPFALSDWDDYERHFTVMNYQKETVLKEMRCEQFVETFDATYPAHSYAGIEKRIFAMLRRVFELATIAPPPKGIGNSPQSGAMFAADIMLEWRKSATSGNPGVQPKLLEINWAPDCKRACEYYPNFFNEIFAALFLDEIGENIVPI